VAELRDRLESDIKDAMRAKERERLTVLRMIKSAIKDREIATRADVGDEEITRILMSYAKKRHEALEGALKAEREDLAEKERAELAIVQVYLPAALSEDELEGLVAAVIAEAGASSMKDMGGVMKLCTERAAGRADGSRISALVRAKLSS
jgi:uncharacterized protein YqeY